MINNKYPMKMVSVSIALACKSTDVHTKALPINGNGQLTIAICTNHTPVEKRNGKYPKKDI